MRHWTDGNRGLKYKGNNEGTGNTCMRQIRHNETAEAKLNTPNMERKTVRIKQETLRRRLTHNMTFFAERKEQSGKLDGLRRQREEITKGTQEQLTETTHRERERESNDSRQHERARGEA